MVLEVMSEPLHADFALVRLLSGMDSHVQLQVGGLRETFAANLAREWPFARVRPHVLIEVVLTSEPLLADFAFNRLFRFF